MLGGDQVGGAIHIGHRLLPVFPTRFLAIHVINKKDWVRYVFWTTVVPCGKQFYYLCVCVVCVFQSNVRETCKVLGFSFHERPSFSSLFFDLMVMGAFALSPLRRHG